MENPSSASPPPVANREAAALSDDPDALLTQVQAARFLNLSVRTLEAWRVRSTSGPVFIKCGKAVRYSRRALLEWVEARQRRSTSDSGAAVSAPAPAEG